MILKEEKEHVTKRFARNKRLWIGYLSLLIISYTLLPLWMTFLIFLAGFLLIPVSMTHRHIISEKPFLVIDSRYLQSKGKTVAWSSVNKIKVKQERLNIKEEKHNYRLIISYMTDKELSFDTCYFKEQQEIIDTFKFLATNRNILLEEENEVTPLKK